MHITQKNADNTHQSQESMLLKICASTPENSIIKEQQNTCMSHVQTHQRLVITLAVPDSKRILTFAMHMHMYA
eukprot:scaffold253937_cov19-Prasinocladus_malaysianus.AAC.1